MLILAALALQVAQPAPPAPAIVRPGATPEGTTPVPISEVAEPLALAVAAFDADHDGRTARVEFDAALARTFAAADANRDGGLGYIEYSAWAQTWLGSSTALPGPFAIDADGDDRITAAEFGAEYGRQFSRFDKDGDGAVNHAELLTVRTPLMAPVLDRDGRAIRMRRRDLR